MVSNVDSFDPDSALARVGKKEIFLKMLAKFIPSYGLATQSIRDALDEDNRELAQRTAHTLRGAAATIGAPVLSAAAAQLEASIAMNESEKYARLIAGVDEELSRVVALVEAYLGANEVILPGSSNSAS